MENHIVFWEVVFPARTSNFTSGQIRKGHPLFSIVKFSTGHLWEDLSRHSSWSMGKQPPQFMGIFTEHFPPKGEICQIQPGGLLSRSSRNCHQRVWQLFLCLMNVLWRVKLNFVKDTWENSESMSWAIDLCFGFLIFWLAGGYLKVTFFKIAAFCLKYFDS